MFIVSQEQWDEDAQHHAYIVRARLASMEEVHNWFVKKGITLIDQPWIRTHTMNHGGTVHVDRPQGQFVINFVRLRSSSGRRKYRCSACGVEGHNRRTCPDAQSAAPLVRSSTSDTTVSYGTLDNIRFSADTSLPNNRRQLCWLDYGTKFRLSHTGEVYTKVDVNINPANPLEGPHGLFGLRSNWEVVPFSPNAMVEVISKP